MDAENPIEVDVPEPATGPGTEHEELLDALSALARAAAAAEKAVRTADPRVDPPGALAALEAVRRLLPTLHAAALGPEALTARENALREATADWRLTRLAAFHTAATEAGVPYERVTTDEIRLGAFTVRLDLDAGEAEVRYAREVLDAVRAEPRLVLDAVRKAGAALHRDVEPAVIFREIALAYRLLLTQLGLPFGERVNLVELLPPLFYVRQTEAFWKKQESRALRPVTRAQLAWDLDALQRAHCLESDGLRIGLGSATAGSTAKKSQVLFLESAAGGGQYFLTFALRSAE